MQKIFVFGSNLSGIHGAGAALYARKHYGAELSVGIGRTGNSYAIPTKDHLINTLPLDVIQKYVEEFIIYANEHSELLFDVTKIGCGLAGYKNEDIAPMFVNAPSNCLLDDEWIQIIEKLKK